MTAEEYLHEMTSYIDSYIDNTDGSGKKIADWMEQYATEQAKHTKECNKDLVRKLGTAKVRIEELEEACDTYRYAYIARRDLTEKEQQIVDNV